MKKYLNISFFLFSIVFLINTSFAQNNISKIEYFIDIDPGFGSGTSVAFTNDTVLDLNFSASLNGLANGFHFLFIRALNDSGWGQTYVHPFSYSENSAFTSLANINKIEYYFDVDPGYDSAISINFTPDSIINILHNSNLTGLTPGLHFLHMRAKDANGQWSLNYNKPFIAIGSAGLPNITELEYYIDTIAGYGLGTSVPITPDSALSEAFYIDLSGISDGFHFLHIRAKDDNGNWSLNYFRPFLCSGSEDFALIDKFEYFFDTDPGYDSGIVVNLTNDTIIDEYFNADLSGLSLGMHMMHIRAKDENGYWSIDYIKPIVVSNSLGFPDINAVEYFIDTDPGYGNGTSVNLAPDSIINQAFTINLNGINPGIHTLFFRALDDNGIWSQTYTRAF
ncbi:MAG: hypothetical protein K9J13_13615, partial [Saprospiraceae bacterium]|nr:hypothetical protein [Saprospiraceae bacterium]